MAKAFIELHQHTLLFTKLPALFLFGALSVLILPHTVFDNRCLSVVALPLETHSTGQSLGAWSSITTSSSTPESNSTEPSLSAIVPNVTSNVFASSSSGQLVNSTKVFDQLNQTAPIHPLHPTPLFIDHDHPNLLELELAKEKHYQKVSFALEIVIRVSIFIYCCLVIGYLCDEFFVPSLESIGEALNLPNDLIGAILIPFGTSGPEIFSSAVGVFFAGNDIGTGAIIGSAVFNLLAIPAASGLAASYFLGDSIKLQEFPILRDLTFYIVSIIVLILVIKDNTVDLIDSSLLGILFVIYISVMLYNAKYCPTKQSTSTETNQKSHPGSDKSQNNINNQNGMGYQNSHAPIVTINNNCNDLHAKINKQKPKNDTNSELNKKNSKNKMKEYINKYNDNEPLMQKFNKLYGNQCDKVLLNDYYLSCLSKQASNKHVNSKDLESKFNSFFEDVIHKQNIEFNKIVKNKSEYEKLDPQDNNGFGFTDNIFLRILLMPFILIFTLTMPTRFASVTFIFSICWLSILSYATVWSISGLSDIVGIPQTISGMTILAAGSAVPDLVTTIIVIKKTATASMGICAAIASNIFAILLGLGLPWGIRFIMNWVSCGNYASSVIVLESTALPFTSIILLATIVALYFTFRICNWRISKRFSLICFIIHILFVGSSVALELLVS